MYMSLLEYVYIRLCGLHMSVIVVAAAQPQSKDHFYRILVGQRITHPLKSDIDFFFEIVISEMFVLQDASRVSSPTLISFRHFFGHSYILSYITYLHIFPIHCNCNALTLHMPHYIP